MGYHIYSFIPAVSNSDYEEQSYLERFNLWAADNHLPVHTCHGIADVSSSASQFRESRIANIQVPYYGSGSLLLCYSLPLAEEET